MKKEVAKPLAVFGVAREAVLLLSAKQRLTFTAIVALRLVINGIDVAAVAALGVLGALTATTLSNQDEVTFLGYSFEGIGPDQALPILGIVLFLFALKAIASILLTRRSAYFLAGVEIEASTHIARHLFSGPVDRLYRYSRSEVQFSVTTSTSALFTGVLGGVSTLVIEAALLVSIFTLFIFADWVGAIAIFAYFVTIVVALQLLVSRKFIAAGRKITSGGIGAGETILEIFNLFRDIAVLGRREYFFSKFEKTKRKQALASASIQVLNLVPKYFIETALIAGAIAFLAWQVSRGDLTQALTALGIFLAGGARAVGAIVPIQSTINNLQVRVRQSELARDLLFQAGKPVVTLFRNVDDEWIPQMETQDPATSNGGFPFTLTDVTYYYPNTSTPALSDVTIAGEPNSFVAIIGHSGAGKSTVADVLLGLAMPIHGTVSIGDASPSKLIEEHPGCLAFVPQKPGLIHGSIAENIALGVPPEDIDIAQVHQVVELSQLSDVVDALPEGIWASLGKHADSLSGGQLQRIGLARALYPSPRLIVLDEATSALDAETESEILKVVNLNRHKCSFVVIAHRLATVQKADVVYVLDSGKVIACGTFAEVRKSVPKIEEYVQLMSFD